MRRRIIAAIIATAALLGAGAATAASAGASVTHPAPSVYYRG